MNVQARDIRRTAVGGAKVSPARLPPGRHGLPREFVEANQHKRLLEAVIAVAGADGHPGLSAARVARTAGVSTSTFYAHFTDREDCLLAACDASLDWLVGGLEEVVAAERDWTLGVCRGLATLVDRLAAEPELARVWFIEISAVGEGGARRRRAALDRLGRALSPPGDSSCDAHLVTEEMIAGGIWHAIRSEIASGSTAGLTTLLPNLQYHVLVYGVEPDAAARAAFIVA